MLLQCIEDAGFRKSGIDAEPDFVARFVTGTSMKTHPVPDKAKDDRKCV
jgi:hypothetical protein